MMAALTRHFANIGRGLPRRVSPLTKPSSLVISHLVPGLSPHADSQLLFKFLCALTVLQTRNPGDPQRTLGLCTALKELLGEYSQTRISQGSAALAGLSCARTSSTSAVSTSYIKPLFSIRSPRRAPDGLQQKGFRDVFTRRKCSSRYLLEQWLVSLSKDFLIYKTGNNSKIV